MIQSPPRPSPRPRPWYPAFDRLAEESGGFRPEDLLIPPDPVPPHLTHLMDVPFLGPCRNWVCTTFRCLCDVPPDAVRHAMAELAGLHPPREDGYCGCGYRLGPWRSCPHVEVITTMAEATWAAAAAAPAV